MLAFEPSWSTINPVIYRSLYVRHSGGAREKKTDKTQKNLSFFFSLFLSFLLIGGADEDVYVKEKKKKNFNLSIFLRKPNSRNTFDHRGIVVFFVIYWAPF
ncbi:hypothetical protein L6452_04555 [Arctium lappa]|uniref:Uncharacterized protein n=1 Tax=Arctium lappa TaxID=4217 RepID=A0ACB9EDY2_ARCLA|nr:hypothetical protein L6452_04555 [Arctium lappa]